MVLGVCATSMTLMAGVEAHGGCFVSQQVTMSWVCAKHAVAEHRKHAETEVQVTPEAYCRCLQFTVAEHIDVGLCACVGEQRLPGMAVLLSLWCESSDEVE